MSNPSAPKIKFAGWIAVAAVIAVAMIAFVSAASRQHGSVASKVAEPAARPSITAEQRARIGARFEALPMAFEANQGQSDPQVKYMARGDGYTLFLTANDAVFSVRSPAAVELAAPTSAGKFGLRTRRASVAASEKTAAIRMQTVGGNDHAATSASAEVPGRINYYLGNDPSKWVVGAKQYSGVTYHDVYPGVNLAFHGDRRQLEFDFIVSPGASPAPIELGFKGADKITTDGAGNLVLSSAAGDVLLNKPVAYQEKDGQRELVNVSFKTAGKKEVAFALGDYDHRRELVIDPSVTFATYLGGTAEDDGYAIAFDGSGNSYVTGQTKSTDFPTVAGGHSTTNAGGFDVFVTKISADGSSLVFSTYVGGSGDDSGNAIQVDGSGDVFVAGGTGSSSNFPTTTGALQTTYGGGGLDAFVFELASSGGSLVYSTYLGGSGNDAALGLALDGSGNAYLVGLTYSTDFPTHNAGALQGSLAGASNGFVSKLNSSGNALTFSTYLGGGTGDFASAVALDSSKNVYVTGATQNATFPTTTGAFQTSCGTAANCNGGLSDAFVTVIKADASGYVYSTFLGGGSADQGLGIAVDSASDAYVTGLTQSNNFPMKSAVQATYGGGTQDAFVTALNPSGSGLLYSTYLGGSAADAGAGIAVDGNKNAYVTGQTGSSNFPTTAGATQASPGGGNDAFVTEINAAGSQIVFSTFLGGSLNEDSTSSGANVSPLGGIAVDGPGANIYVVGNTASTNFPTVGPEQAANGGGFDAFVAKYSTAASPSFTIADGALSATSGNPGASATATITVTSTSGFNSAVALSCAVSPVVAKGPTCSFSNPGSSVTPPANGSVTAMLNIATTAATAALQGPSNRHPFGIAYAALLPFAGLMLLAGGFRSADRGKKKLIATMMLITVLTGLLLLPACSSSSSNTGGGGNGGTPAGAYTFTVTGTSGGTVVTGTPTLSFTVN